MSKKQSPPAAKQPAGQPPGLSEVLEGWRRKAASLQGPTNVRRITPSPGWQTFMCCDGDCRSCQRNCR